MQQTIKSYRWFCRKCLAHGVVKIVRGSLWPRLIDAHRAASPKCFDWNIEQVPEGARDIRVAH